MDFPYSEQNHRSALHSLANENQAVNRLGVMLVFSVEGDVLKKLEMRFTNIRLASLGLVPVMGTLPAQATVIDVNFTFAEPDWSATVTYNDTSGEPWAGPWSGSITAYALDALEITRAGTATWGITELIGSSTPPDGGLLRDTAGTLALFLQAYDAASNLELSALPFVYQGAIVQPIIVVLDETGFSVSTSVYSARANVSEPAAPTLISLDLVGLGAFRMRKQNRE